MFFCSLWLFSTLSRLSGVFAIGSSLGIGTGLAVRSPSVVVFNYVQCTVKMLKNANYAPQNAPAAKCYPIIYEPHEDHRHPRSSCVHFLHHFRFRQFPSTAIALCC